jgi:bacteriocin biosynthesis cyclodehydratase domain-containing protein
MSRLPTCPCLALPFTVLASPDQVRLVAGEDFRFTLAGPGLDVWLPGWLGLLDGHRTLDEALARLPADHHAAARQLVERLFTERVLLEGPVEFAHSAQPYPLSLEGTGVLREALAPLVPSTEQASRVRVLCQDRLDLDEMLRFNERCLTAGSPWLWVSCAALGRGYVSPVFLSEAGPCLACLLGHFRRRSPLPALHDELVAHARGGGAIPAVPVPGAGVHILAHLTAWKAGDCLAQPEPSAALYRLHVLEVGTLEVSSHPVFVDPECPACHGRR